jgi:plastocyanin
MRRKLSGYGSGLLVVLVVLALALSACSSASTPTGSPTSTSTTASTSSTSTAPPQNVTIDLVAKNIAFDKGTITVPAGAQVTVNFDNQDSGVPHNFSVYTDSSAKQSIFVGQIITGPQKTTYTFEAPPTPGTYFFRCDVHPSQMTGTFIVQ